MGVAAATAAVAAAADGAAGGDVDGVSLEYGSASPS